METENLPHDEWEAQLIEYTMGGMDPSESAVFEASLEECRRHVLLARQYGEVAGWLGAAAAPTEPPEGHKARLMSRIATTTQDAELSSGALSPGAPAVPGGLPPLPRPEKVQQPTSAPVREDGRGEVKDLGTYREAQRGRVAAWAVAGAAVAAIVIFMLGLVVWNANSELDRTRRELAALQQRINIPPGYQAVKLAPQPEYPDANAVVFYNPEKNDAYVLADSLYPLPPEKVYELWIVPQPGKGSPVASGVFRPDDRGWATHTTVAPSAIKDFAGFAISEERAPGVPVREGPPVAVGLFATP
jgi:anti-sigma-K factor RskA